VDAAGERVEAGGGVSPVCGFVVPSPLESLSLLALEAMAVGTPVLCNARADVLVEHCKNSNAGLFYQDRDEFLSIGQSLLLGLALAAAAPLGDLFESLLKRDMGVKDSGRILGGHGGVLDRVDAQLFAAVAGFYVILAFDKV